MNTRYDWNAIQNYYDLGHTVRECVIEFGFCKASWTKAVNSGYIKPRSNKKSLEDLKPQSRRSIKQRLIESGTPYLCTICGISEWCGKSITLQLDHIDGVHTNHTRENWRLLCPNCHSQTDTFCGKNTKQNREARNVSYLREHQ